MQGFIRAVADQTHPLQTKLSLILTDFEPNRNKQGVPLSEAENILFTAKNTPLKINFDGDEYYGHKGAYPIGPITEVYRSQDNGREVIAAEAVIWKDIYTDVSEHIQVAFAEGIGTSWEIYYDEDLTSTDSNGVQWLGGCVFAGTCIVDTPAYGPNRTRLLAIAEELNKHEVNMAKAENTTEVVQNVETTKVDNTASAADTTLTSDISGAMEMLSNLYEGLWNMIDQADELERNLASSDLSSVAEQFAKAISAIQKRFDALKSKAESAEVVQAELTELKNSIAQAEADRKAEETKTTRKATLAELGIDFDTKADFYLAMADEVFAQYVDDLKVVHSKNTASAEVKPAVIPEPTNGANTTISIQELAAILRGDK